MVISELEAEGLLDTSEFIVAEPVVDDAGRFSAQPAHRFRAEAASVPAGKIRSKAHLRHAIPRAPGGAWANEAAGEAVETGVAWAIGLTAILANGADRQARGSEEGPQWNCAPLGPRSGRP